MYGTMFHMRPRPGHEQAILDGWDAWDRDRRPKVEGAIANYLFRLASGELAGVAVFSSRETYLKNASDPDQDRWYRQLRDNLEADPVWEDGEILRGG